jgi:hypothetical protein
VIDEQRLRHAHATLEALARLDEHVVATGRRAVLGEAVRGAAILPAIALAADEPDRDWREEMRSSLRSTGALLCRVVLAGRSLAVPSPEVLLQLVDSATSRPRSEAEHRAGRHPWYDKHPLWGRIAYISWLCGELAHESGDVEADCLGALWALGACLELLEALDPDGELGSALRRP